jgi:hypothetical protein
MTYGRNNYPSKTKKEPRNPEDESFQSITVYLPKSVYCILKAKSDQTNLPLSRLVAYAVDNELACGEPFRYDTALLDKPYVQDAYSEEANKIYKFLEKTEKSAVGIGRDLLMLARRDIGIMNKDEFLLALRELYECDVIEEVKPSNKTFKKYDEMYRLIKTKKVNAYELKKRTRKQLETV